MVTLDVKLNDPKAEYISKIKIKRQDAMRGRVRTVARNGEEIIVDLPRGEVIDDGEILKSSTIGNSYKLLIEQEPVVKVTLNNKENSNHLENALKLGYNLGNRHLEVLIEDEIVFVPITIGEEKVKKILDKIKLPIKYETVNKIVSPNSEGYHAGEDE